VKFRRRAAHGGLRRKLNGRTLEPVTDARMIWTNYPDPQRPWVFRDYDESGNLVLEGNEHELMPTDAEMYRAMRALNEAA